jgi:hypothetical protein
MSVRDGDADRSSSDLFNSTRELRAPSTPFVPFTDSWGSEQEIALSRQERILAQPALNGMGSSFHVIWMFPDAPAVLQLLQIIDHMRDVSVIIENYIEGHLPPRPPAALTDQRNFTHRKLMGLSTARDIELRGYSLDTQYEACRLACIVYSFLVIFPLPPTVQLYERLTTVLQKAASGIAIDPDDRVRMHLQAWILTMGALISIDLPERPWFIAQLAQLLHQVGIATFVQFCDMLQRFLWHPRTSAGDAAELWQEIARFQRSETISCP